MVTITSPLAGTVFVVGIATSVSLVGNDQDYECSFDPDFANIRGTITVTGRVGTGDVTAGVGDAGELSLYIREVGGTTARATLACTVITAAITLDLPAPATELIAGTVTTFSGTCTTGCTVALYRATGESDKIADAVVVGATWSYDYAPSIADVVAGLTAVYAVATLGPNTAEDSVAITVALPGDPDAFHFAASGASYMTLSGSDVTQWHDLTRNTNHATDGTTRPVFTEPGGGADPYLAFTKEDADRLLIPYAWANGLSECSVAVSMQTPGSGTYHMVWDFYNGLKLAYLTDVLFIWHSSSPSSTVSPVVTNTDHTILVTYDGSITVVGDRVKVWVDGEHRPLESVVAWPATLAASHSAGRLGQRGDAAFPLTGRMHAFSRWNHALDEAEIAEFFTMCRAELAYTSTWSDTGTTLTEHFNASPTLGAELALTASGLTVTPGSPVTVYDKAALHVAFTSLRKLDATTYRVYFRNGAEHVESTGKIQYCESIGGYAVWGVPVDIVNTVGVDDRDPRVCDYDGTETILWVKYPDEGTLQLFRQPVAGGAVTNVCGYPQVAATQAVSSQGQAVEGEDIIVTYGGPNTYVGRLGTVIAGTDVYWTSAPSDGGGDTYKIYEPSVLRLASGDLLLVARTGHPASATGPCLQLRSADDGVTWASAQLFPATHGGEPLGLDSPFVFQMSTGTLVVVGRRKYATGVPLTLLYSTDDGATWSAPVDLFDLTQVDSGYCGVVEIDSTHILLSYYYDSATEIRVVPVTIS